MAKGPGPGWVLVYCAYVVRNGKRIYPKNGKCFRFWVKADKTKS